MYVRLLSAIFAAALTLFLFSCQTAPEEEPAEEEPVQEEPVAEEEAEAEPMVAAPEAERNEAENLRAYITDNELAQYAEASFSNAQSRHQEAESAYGSDNAQSAELYDEAISLYRDVLEKSVNALRNDYKEQVNSLRQEAEQLKTAKALPEEHQAAMELLEQTEAAYEAGNFRKAHELSLQALEQLQLTVRRAREKRQQALEVLQDSQSSLEETQQQIQQYESEAALEDETQGETEQ
jgi:hypothetical protein